IHGLNAASDPVIAVLPAGRFLVGGTAFNRGGTSKLFITQWEDRNDSEGGDTFVYNFTRAIDVGAVGRFLDKPGIAADVNRVSADAAACGTVYMTYSVFTGIAPSGQQQSQVMFTRSLDCGSSWSRPVKISGSSQINQGTSIAIDPLTGRLYIVWRS